MKMRTQQIARTIVNRSISKNISLYKKHMGVYQTLLDIGTGNGMQALYIQKALPHLSITCLDIDDYRYREAKKLPHVVYNGKHIPFPNRSFDCCLLLFVLHHAADATKVLSEAVRVSKHCVIVFEEVYENTLQKVLMQLYDVAVNALLFGERISFPRFRTRREWLSIFRTLNIKDIDEVVQDRKWYYPPQRIFFILKK